MSTVDIDIIKLKKMSVDAAYGAMYGAVEYLKSAVDEAIRKKGTGRIYKRGNVSHQASSPGMPPATDTGALRQSLAVSVSKLTNGVSGVVSANTNYALALELGTSKMAARPYLRSTLEKNKAQIARAVSYTHLTLPTKRIV